MEKEGIIELMKIRQATVNDVSILQNLNDEVFVDNYKYDPDLKMDWAQSKTGKEYFTDVVNNPNAICLIAEENGKAVGYIAAQPKEFGYRLSKYIEIENMGVSPEYRSKGIGLKLMEKCLEVAKEKGFKKAYVNAYSDNVGAVKFYEKNGFNKIDVSLEKNI